MKRNIWFSLTLLLLLSPQLKSQDEKFKALFMYNFTKYLEWPSSRSKGDFVIGIYGASPIYNDLRIIAEKRKVGTQQIVVKKLSQVSELAECHIVYVPENRSGKINEVSNNCKGQGIVIISDKPGLAKSHSGINYVKIDGKQNFEINKKNLEAEGIKINSALLSLGILVE
jgi:hypothetical protein